MSEPIRVAVVGLGIGKAHLEAYLRLPEQFAVTALCDLDSAKATALAERHGIPHVVGSLSGLCKMEEIEVIDLCTPPFLHFEQLCEVLSGGKHAICEKPLVGSLQQADELERLEHVTGRRIMPIFQYRFGHGLQKLKHLVAHEVTGKAFMTTVETAWRRRDDYYRVPWRGKWATELGGALVSHALHAHDMLTYLLGPVRRVAAFTTTRVNPIEVEDCAVVSLEMADGSLASLSVTLGSAAEISRHRFCFEHLSAESGTASYNNSSEPWTFTPDSAEAEAHISEALSAFKPSAEGYEGQFLRYFHALRGDAALPVTLRDARDALELATAIYHAAETGCSVSLPLGEKHPRYAAWFPRGPREGAS